MSSALPTLQRKYRDVLLPNEDDDGDDGHTPVMMPMARCDGDCDGHADDGNDVGVVDDADFDYAPNRG